MPNRPKTLVRDMQAIRAALRQLQKSFDRLMPALAAASKSANAKAPRKLRITPARRAALKLQGQYMGYMRNLRPAQKSRVRKIREAKGIRSAIAAAKRLSR